MEDSVYKTSSPDLQKQSAMDELDAELDILNKTVEVLRHRLELVLTRFSTPKLSSPDREEASSALRGRVWRLHEARVCIEEMIGELDI